MALVAMVAGHGTPYVAIVTPAHHLDLMNKIYRGSQTLGAEY
jgi:pyruvate/2-oxoacid:ferredoxin oxidoreductase beta subunit